MKRIYFVDLENVAAHFLFMSENLTAEDMVLIFMRHTQYGIPDMKSSLEKAISDFREKRIHYQIIDMKSSGKNAMDFQICTALGYMVGLHGTNAEYYIISEDRGYESAAECVQTSLAKGAKIEFTKDFSVVKTSTTVKEELKSICKDCPKKAINIAATAYEKSSSLIEYHNNLQESGLRQDLSTKIFELTKDWYCKRRGLTTPEEKEERFQNWKKEQRL